MEKIMENEMGSGFIKISGLGCTTYGDSWAHHLASEGCHVRPSLELGWRCGSLIWATV